MTLYGSLSLAGKGHLTDQAIQIGLSPLSCKIVWCDEALSFHPNGMRFEALNKVGVVTQKWITYSVGGGELFQKGGGGSEHPQMYTQTSMADVLKRVEHTRKPIWATG